MEKAVGFLGAPVVMKFFLRLFPWSSLWSRTWCRRVISLALQDVTVEAWTRLGALALGTSKESLLALRLRLLPCCGFHTASSDGMHVSEEPLRSSILSLWWMRIRFAAVTMALVAPHNACRCIQP